ncbi:MAG: gamma-glutamyl-gamma-aminobutyrate hydrolase family protein [Solirubrobacteraceae bacterium]
MIGITAYLAQASWGPWADVRVSLLPYTYVRAVTDAGGRPVLLPTIPGADETGTLDLLDGLILGGGPDIDPARYGQAAGPHTVASAPERDEAESALLRGALDRDLPVLGICRGMQLLNIVRGGTLVQHLSEHATPPGSFGQHEVVVQLDSVVGAAIGGHAVVHSGHHQGVASVGCGLRVVGQAPDGVIEAIEDPYARFCVGALWHPEQGSDGGLFRALVEASGGT